MSSAIALDGAACATQLHEHAGCGPLTLQLPSQVAVSLQVALPTGTPLVPPQKSWPYSLKTQVASALQSSSGVVRRHGKNAVDDWQPVVQLASYCTPHAISLAHAVSQRCASVSVVAMSALLPPPPPPLPPAPPPPSLPPPLSPHPIATS